jgi:hypothetical protein
LKEIFTDHVQPMKKIAVERIPMAHPRIRAKDWLAPLVRRLDSHDRYKDGNRKIHFSLRNREGRESNERCDFRWAGMKEDFDLACRTYQTPVLTEFATYALACASVEHFTGKQITNVTMRGQRVDFWIGDYEFVLEVSGQVEGDLLALHEKKQQQFQENPMEKSGYVCVANYSQGQARFWFHEYET